MQMEVIVEDANILIDLFNTGLIRHCQKMDVEFHTTKYVVKEIDDPNQSALLEALMANKLLLVDNIEGEDFMLFTLMAAEYKAISNLTDEDCSVMFLAEKLNCRLLTSDQKLKRHAMERGIQTNGLLWIVDMLVDDGVVSPADMITYMQNYLDTNSRAPEVEINRRIEWYRDMIEESK